jgi:hypothetical protein
MNQPELAQDNKVLAAILIVFGLLLLIGQLGSVRLNLGAISLLLLLKVAGVIVIALGLGRGTKGRPMIGLGSILLVSSIVLEYLDIAGLFQALPWAIVQLAAIGLGLLIHTVIIRQVTFLKPFINLIIIGAILFILDSAFFEFTLKLSGLGDSLIGQLIEPFAMIGLGVILLWRQRNTCSSDKGEVTAH